MFWVFYPSTATNHTAEGRVLVILSFSNEQDSQHGFTQWSLSCALQGHRWTHTEEQREELWHSTTGARSNRWRPFTWAWRPSLRLVVSVVVWWICSIWKQRDLRAGIREQIHRQPKALYKPMNFHASATGVSFDFSFLVCREFPLSYSRPLHQDRSF